jgi:hypothetical protein
MQKSSKDFKKVKQQFKAWRERKPRQRGIGVPAMLWEAAVSLCENNSIQAVSQELGLNAGRLRKKVAEIKKVEAAKPRGDFFSVELPEIEKAGIPDPVFEWTRPDGAKLCVRMPASELGAVMAAFLGVGA